jgi:hypothetical protein
MGRRQVSLKLIVGKKIITEETAKERQILMRVGLEPTPLS